MPNISLVQIRSEWKFFGHDSCTKTGKWKMSTDITSGQQDRGIWIEVWKCTLFFTTTCLNPKRAELCQQSSLNRSATYHLYIIPAQSHSVLACSVNFRWSGWRYSPCRREHVKAGLFSGFQKSLGSKLRSRDAYCCIGVMATYDRTWIREYFTRHAYSFRHQNTMAVFARLRSLDSGISGEPAQ